MSLLTPLGFLGLIGIAILILIYILKPNYQQKIISSTYVWKLSLKKRRKKVPISKLRNILILICQVLIITACAFILAQPFIEAELRELSFEKIAIVDASANMLTSKEETRFERAVAETKDLAKSVFAEGGYFSVILADSEPYYVVQRMGPDRAQEVYEMLDALVDPDGDGYVDRYNMACSYGKADIDAAMTLAEAVLVENPDAEVVFYTGTYYYDTGKVSVVDVSEGGEWNAAILDVRAVLEENYYTFEVDIACFGMDLDIPVDCYVSGANGESDVTLSMTVHCQGDEVQTVLFNAENSGFSLYAYDSASIFLRMDQDDSFDYDNAFYLFGGKKPTIRIQYESSAANSFFGGALMTLREEMRNKWEIELKEIRGSMTAESEGFDIYIYENKLPAILPTDGLVFIVDPNRESEGLGLTLDLGNPMVDRNGLFLAPGVTHPITNYVTPEHILLTRYTRVTEYEGFTPLMFCGGDPVLLLRNEPEVKIVLFSFSLNRSDLSVLFDWPVLFYNIFTYFMPTTLTDYVFDVNEDISVSARGTSVTVKGPGMETILEDLPQSISVPIHGTYTVEQTIMSGATVTESFYVRIPRAESDIFREEDTLANPYVEKIPEPIDYDLLIWLAAALLALLFVEWWLQSRDQF